MDEQRRQDYLRLIERFLNCASEQELNDVFNAHRGLIDRDFLQEMARVAQDFEAQGNAAAATWLLNLMAGLAQAMGLDMAPPPNAEASAQFLVEILQCIATHQSVAKPAYTLLNANQAKLNADLLAALPGVSASWLARVEGEDQKYIVANVLYLFGNLLAQFPLGQRAINIELAIAAYEQVLQVNTREAMPVEWATVQMNLANAYSDRIRGDRAENLEQAITAYEQVLQVMTREAMPVDWARAQMNLALTYSDRIRGDRAENLEQAITAYEQVLQVMTREAMPVAWAQAQMNLANAYSDRIRGDRAENLEQAIAAYEQVLQVVTREAMPIDWARAQMNLARAYSNRIRGDCANNLEQVIAAYEQVLQVVTRAAMPVEWAQAQMGWANAYSDRIRGDRADNLEQAIAAYEQVLEVMTRAAMPVEWATAQMNLANAYRNRIRGDRAENLEQAIAAYEQVLEVMTRATMPVEWATAQMNLAIAYSERIRGDSPEERLRHRGENLEQLIAAYEQVLEVMTRAAMPVKWATVQINLANAYRNRIRGDRAENLEQAIAAYEQVLEVMTREAMPVDWARAQMGWANAYSDRIRGDRADNLEQAIAAYEQVLQVMTREAMPVGWASVQMNLASAYFERIRGDRAENLEQAIAAYDQVLQVRTRAAMPVKWATAQMNLANAYSQRIRGDRAENLEQAIAAYEQVLQVRTREAMPMEWATAQINLASAYSDRIRGNSTDNLEKAIAVNEAVLEVMTCEAMPREWAMTQMNLGNAYRKRIRGDQADNLDRAIAAYQDALQVNTLEAMPREWAMTRMNLAIAYAERTWGDWADNLECAIAAYQDVLQVRTREAMPLDWAITQINLAIAYAERIWGDRANNLECAIAAYQDALQVITHEAMPVEWAKAQMNLANAYRNRIHGERANNLEHAIAAYQVTLQVNTRKAIPLEWAKTQMNLAIAYRAADRWPEAHTTYAETIDGIEDLRSEIKSGDDAKQKHAEEWNGLYQGMVTTCLHLGNPAEALEYADRSKARNLVDLLANRVEPQNVPPATLAEFHRFKKAIKTEELRLQSEELTRLRPIAPDQAETYTTRPIPDRTQLNTLIQQLEHLIKDDIKPHDSKFVATQTVEPLTYPQIQALLPNPQTALIEWYIQNDRVLTFVVTQHSPTPTVISIDTEGLNQLKEWTARYLTNYASASANWQTDLGAELGTLADILQINNVLASEALAECSSLILIPHRYLHLLPLHALPLTTHPSLLDRFSGGIRYAPCCQLLYITQQPTHTDFTHLLAIQNPTEDLPFTDVEVASLRPLFDSQVKVLSKHEAHKAAVTTYPLQPGHVLHFACHGQFNWQDPLQAGLLLAASPPASTPSKDDQETDTTTDSPQDAASSEGDSEANSTEEQKSPHLTLGNLFSRDIDLTHCRLVTLSACETGQVDFRPTSDEYIGLPSGFLFAGSPSVVSSLWRVSDISTSFLMVQFYQRLKAGQPVPIALNQAQIWLRQVTKAELEPWATQLSLSPARRLYLKGLLHKKDPHFRPFESPYHWAAFCAVGS